MQQNTVYKMTIMLIDAHENFHILYFNVCISVDDQRKAQYSPEVIAEIWRDEGL